MKIFNATADEREDDVALGRAAGLTRPWSDPVADFDMALRNPKSTVLAAREGGGPAATIMAGFDGHWGWIYHLAARADLRRKGIARVMMKSAEQWLAEQGCPKVQPMVRSENEGTLGFYAAPGYSVQDVNTLGHRLDPR